MKTIIILLLLILTSHSVFAKSLEMVPTPVGTHLYLLDDSFQVIDTSDDSFLSAPLAGSGYGRETIVSADGTIVYVLDSTTNSVAVIDTVTRLMVKKIKLPSKYFRTIAINENRAYVIGKDIIVIDMTTHMVSAIIPVGNGSTDIAFSPDGTRAYILHYQVIYVLDTITNQIISGISLGVELNDTTYLTITPDGRKIYFQDFYDKSLWVVNLVDESIYRGENILDFDNTAISFIPNSPQAYVYGKYHHSSTDLNPVNVLDFTNDTIVASIQMVKTHAMAITPDNLYAYFVTCDGHVNVVDTTSHCIIKTISLDEKDGCGYDFKSTITIKETIKITPDGKKVYVYLPMSCYRRCEECDSFIKCDDTFAFHVIDTSTNTVIAKIKEIPSSLY